MPDNSDKGNGAAHTVVEALWQGQSNKRVRSLQAAFADAIDSIPVESSVPERKDKNAT